VAEPTNSGLYWGAEVAAVPMFGAQKTGSPTQRISQT